MMIDRIDSSGQVSCWSSSLASRICLQRFDRRSSFVVVLSFIWHQKKIAIVHCPSSFHHQLEMNHRLASSCHHRIVSYCIVWAASYRIDHHRIVLHHRIDRRHHRIVNSIDRSSSFHFESYIIFDDVAAAAIFSALAFSTASIPSLGSRRVHQQLIYDRLARFHPELVFQINYDFVQKKHSSAQVSTLLEPSAVPLR